jgi:flagellar export protein FliJ
MKALSTLLRVARRDMNTLRRALAGAIARQNAVEQKIRALAENVAAERQNAQKDYESARAFSGFALLAAARRKGLEADATSINAECDRLRALIIEAHVECSKFERLIGLREERARKAAEKREADELDEMTTQRAARFSPR